MDARQRHYLLEQLQAVRNAVAFRDEPKSAVLIALEKRIKSLHKRCDSIHARNGRAQRVRVRRADKALDKFSAKVAAVDSYAKGLAILKAFKARKF